MNSISAISLMLLISWAANAAELRSETTHAWENYLASAEARMAERAHGNFLWIDESPERARRVRSGEIVVAPMQSKMPIAVPHGLVHHLIGAAFVPGVHLRDVLARLREYELYDEFYTPALKEIQVVEKDANTDRSHDRFVVTLTNEHLFSKHALEAEYICDYIPIDDHRTYSLSSSVRTQEWSEYGSAKQHKLPEGEGSGYIWNLSTISRYQERDGGVYVEVEAIALSRDIQPTLHFIVDPIVRGVAKASLTTSLEETRKAVETRMESATLSSKAGGL